VDELLAVLAKEATAGRRRRYLGVGVIVGYIALIVGLVLSGHVEQMATFTGLMGTIGLFFAASQTQKNAAHVLSEHDDLRVVGPLAEAIEYDDKDTAAGAEVGLVRLLPRLQASDHALLTHEQRRALDRALTKKVRLDLKLAILAAYEQIGDPLSVPVVERVAAGLPKGIRDPNVERRAAEALPGVRAAAERVRASQTLLRPVESVPTDTLLRPAESAPTAPLETPLRPAATEPASLRDRAEDAPQTTSARIG
jgi:hypothetical protein